MDGVFLLQCACTSKDLLETHDFFAISADRKIEANTCLLEDLLEEHDCLQYQLIKFQLAARRGSNEIKEIPTKTGKHFDLFER